MSNIYKTVGEKIRELRTHYNGRGISQDALATEIGTALNTISRWETATYKPSVSDVQALANFFGATVSVFFAGMEMGPKRADAKRIHVGDASKKTREALASREGL